MATEYNMPTAGVIVLNDKNETILVETHRGNFSFPKGGRNRKETNFDCACRELFEETGIKKEQITFFDDISYIEYSKKEKPSVKYYVGKFNNYANHIFKFDPNELVSCKWYNIDDIINGSMSIKPSRKIILEKIKNDIDKNSN